MVIIRCIRRLFRISATEAAVAVVVVLAVVQALVEFWLWLAAPPG
ncbi:MAG: hypothetical protein ACK5YV_07600 [Betaproteobacteria bacterium]|jgi:heme/copper-type cytochrome/quinol oxidase subunit 4